MAATLDADQPAPSIWTPSGLHAEIFMARAKPPPQPQAAIPPSGMRGITAGGEVTQATGDVFSNIGSSTIINRSTLEGALNKISTSADPKFRADVEEMLAIIANEGREEAVELFNVLAEELAR